MTLDEKILETKADLYCLLNKKRGDTLSSKELMIMCALTTDPEVQDEVKRMEQCRKTQS